MSAATKPLTAERTERPKELRILVVGGGVAGLTVAYKLMHDARWGAGTHITLVERKDRFGGRVKTMRVEATGTPTKTPTKTQTHTKRRSSSSSSSSQQHQQPPPEEWYEAGASRIGDTHHRVRALGKQLGCREVRLPESHDQRQAMPALHAEFGRIRQAFVDQQGANALRCVSWHDVMTVVCTPDERDALQKRWGFLSVIVEMNAHDFWEHAMPQYLCAAYYTYANGLQSLPDALAGALEHSPNVTLQKHTRVMGIRQRADTLQFDVELQEDAVANAYSSSHTSPPAAAGAAESAMAVTETVFDMVFVALPAEALETIPGVLERFGHYWSAVSRNRLIRCYAKYPDRLVGASPQPSHVSQKRASAATSTRKRRRRQSGRLLQLPDSDLGKDAIKSSVLCKCTTTSSPPWRQIAYCDHRHADHLYNALRMPEGLTYFRQTVSAVLGADWGAFRNEDFDVHYWKAGTHSWKPQLLADDHYERAMHPDAKLPLFVVGASLSHYQHWMEGALETVDAAYKKSWRYAVEWLGRGNPKRRSSSSSSSSSSPQDHHHPRDPLVEPFFLHHACAEDARKHTMADVKRRNWVVLDGYVYDVQPFMDRHPGGRALLQRMLGTDITTTYHRIGHSSTARAWAEENCMGVLDRPTSRDDGVP
jgi:hypothetical protein